MYIYIYIYIHVYVCMYVLGMNTPHILTCPYGHIHTFTLAHILPTTHRLLMFETLKKTNVLQHPLRRNTHIQIIS